MASSDTKSGFRLPWSSDRAHDEAAPEGVDAAADAQAEPTVRRPRVAGHRHPRPPGHLHQRAAPARRSRTRCRCDRCRCDRDPGSRGVPAHGRDRSPRRPRRGAQEAVEADGGPVGCDPCDRVVGPRPGAPADRGRRQGGHRVDPRGRDRRRRDPAQAVGRRHRRDPRLVQGRDRAHPRGDRQPHRDPQGPARGRAVLARGLGEQPGRRGAVRGRPLQGRHGRVLRPPEQRERPVAARDDGRGDARPAVVRGLGRRRHAGRHRAHGRRGDGRGRRGRGPSRRPSRSRTPPRR